MSAVEELAKSRGFPYLKLAELLSEYDPAEVRADLCCHYNDRGHEVLDAKLGPAIVQAVQAHQAAAKP